MAKATITIEDTTDKRFIFGVEFVPSLPDHEEDATPAQIYAIEIYDRTLTGAAQEGRSIEIVNHADLS